MAHYKYIDIVNSFKTCGLHQGCDVFLHTNLGFFGVCEGVRYAKELSEVFYKALREVVGESGTIIVPTFTYSSCHNEDFDPNTTPCNMGMFVDYILQLPDTVRSLDPNFSVAAIGAKAVYYTCNPPQKSFGDNCFFERFVNNNGIICNLNFDAGTTLVHYIEHKLQVPYRYDKKFEGRVFVNGQWEKRSSYHFVCDKPENEAYFERLQDLALEQGICRTVNLGRGQMLSESSQDLFKLIKETFRTRPRFLLKVENI